MRQRRLVWHRWNLPEGQQPPAAGDLLLGRTPRHHWRVVEVIPVESPVHPNAFRARMEPLGHVTAEAEAAARWRYTP